MFDLLRRRKPAKSPSVKVRILTRPNGQHVYVNFRLVRAVEPMRMADGAYLTLIHFSDNHIETVIDDVYFVIGLVELQGVTHV